MTTLSDTFLLTSGAHVGREHVRTHRGSQDSLALRIEPDRLIAVVSDGCSSGISSEVGAHLTTRWLTATLARIPELDSRAPSDLLEPLGEGLVAYLTQVLTPLERSADERPGLVRDLFLATWLAAVVTPSRTLIFGQGDGVFAVNGQLTCLDSGPSNAPDYPAYGLLPRAALNASPQTTPRLHYAGATASLERLLIGTDGCLDLERRRDDALKDGTRIGGILTQLEDPALFAHPTRLRKRLTVLGEVNGKLWDDTAVVLIRRRTLAVAAEASEPQSEVRPEVTATTLLSSGTLFTRLSDASKGEETPWT